MSSRVHALEGLVVEGVNTANKSVFKLHDVDLAVVLSTEATAALPQGLTYGELESIIEIESNVDSVIPIRITDTGYSIDRGLADLYPPRAWPVLKTFSHTQ